LTASQVPLDLSKTSIVICDSKVKHNLSDSGYNTRRRECEEGAKILQKFLPEIKELWDVGLADVEKYQAQLPDVIKKRCRHVITENKRTLEAAKILKANDLAEFRRLMNFSHESMRDDFEISCAEIDLLVETAQSLDGVLGSRMTGGGFGGSTVSLVKTANLSEFTDKICRKYEAETGIQPAIYVTKAEEGACEIL
jgi:galactokinase